MTRFSTRISTGTTQDLVGIGETEYDVGLGIVGGAGGIGPFTVGAGEILDVYFVNEQFYVGGVEFHSVRNLGRSRC